MILYKNWTQFTVVNVVWGMVLCGVMAAHQPHT